MNIQDIEDKYSGILRTQVRNKKSESEELRDSVFELGRIIGQKITGNLAIPEQVITPMEKSFNGVIFPNKTSVIISTEDDFEFLAKGVASIIKNSVRGFMNFGSTRGQAALNAPVRSASLPDLKFASYIDNLIIVKSVLATGCTAISLTNKAIEKYKPKNLIIATIFYSIIGIQELSSEFPHATIYLFGDPDELDSNGMLQPGVGNIDARLNPKHVVLSTINTED